MQKFLLYFTTCFGLFCVVLFYSLRQIIIFFVIVSNLFINIFSIIFIVIFICIIHLYPLLWINKSSNIGFHQRSSLSSFILHPSSDCITILHHLLSSSYALSTNNIYHPSSSSIIHHIIVIVIHHNQLFLHINIYIHFILNTILILYNNIKSTLLLKLTLHSSSDFVLCGWEKVMSRF